MLPKLLECPQWPLRLMRGIEMGNQNGIKNLRTGTPHSYAHAFGSPVRACVEANPPSLPYLGSMSNENELTTFLDQEEHNEFKQVIQYLDTQKRGLPYNDPERIRMNFLKQFLYTNP